MIHFDFIVEDVDAENIMWALRDYALKNDEDIMDYEARKDSTREQKDSYVNCLKDNKAYMLGLIEKMTNTRVEEVEGGDRAVLDAARNQIKEHFGVA